MSSYYVDLDTVRTRCVVNEGKDDKLVITGYKSTRNRTFIFHLLTVATLGILRLWIYWKPSYRSWCYKKCVLDEASVVSVENSDGDFEFCEVLERRFPESSSHTTDDQQFNYSSIPTTQKARTRSSWKHSLFNADTVRPFSYLEDLIQNGNDFDSTTVRYFVYRHLHLIYNDHRNDFSLLVGLDGRVRCNDLVERYHGWTRGEQICRREIFGTNTIDVKVPSYLTLFYREALNPFYVFQLCSLILWIVDDYYVYALCILILTFISIGFELYETRAQICALHSMVSTANKSIIKIRRRDGLIELVPGADLTPGDIVMVPPIDSSGFLMPCDVVLLNGSCIVDESSLTGESVPVAKVALVRNDEEDMVFHTDSNQKHVLYCGTKVIQARLFTSGEMYGVVVRTGFSSSKGSMIRSVIYPKVFNFGFYRDAALFLCVMAMIAAAGTIYSLSIFISRGMQAKKVITNSLDIITIVVPPALPAAMSVGVWYSQRRLKAKQIYSISPQRINLCGKLDLICFDKTGTLTEECLELNGIIACEEGTFLPWTDDLSTQPFGHLLCCLTTCHNLTVIDEKLTGESLDLRIFEATGWEMEIPNVCDGSAMDSSFAPTVVKPPKRNGQTINRIQSVDDLMQCPPLELGIVRQFPFSSDLQRCTVVARRLGNYPMAVYCKGAPEQIAALCIKETVPADFKTVIDKEALLGRRILALAHRSLPKKTLWHHVQRMKREDLECEMEFLGLVIFRNKLKPETTPVIDELRTANIKCVMVTGDNLLTSLCVARECHVISDYDDVYTVNAVVPRASDISNLEINFRPFQENWNAINYSYQNGSPYMEGVKESTRFALIGPHFSLIREYSMDILKEIVSKGVVFSRMKPVQKAQLIEIFQELGYVVGMCGDGANDCSALKAAHAGVSLSDLEASVAAPFTCKVQTIECIPELIKEGRCALVTSFGVFKYMMIYSMIQFVSVLILYSMNLFFADYMYLFIDLFIITVVAIFMGRTGPSNELHQMQPSAKLFSFETISSLLTHMLILIGIQLGAIFYLKSRIWYGPVFPHPNDELSFSWETTTIFFVSCYQYLLMALVFASGQPYRKSFYTNFPFVFALLLFSLILASMLFFRIDFIDQWLELIPIPYGLWRFKVTIILLVLLNLVASLFVEFSYSPTWEIGRVSNELRNNKPRVVSQRLDSMKRIP